MAVTMRYTIPDDAFITYRYAYNLATGHGFVYNLGERHLGTTAPLYGLLLGVLAVPQPTAIPIIGLVLSAVSLVAGGLALYVYGRISGAPLGGFVGALFFVTSPVLVGNLGLETMFQIGIILWAFVAYRLGRFTVAASMLAFAILVRADSIVALGVIAVHFGVTQRRIPWRDIGVISGIILPFALAAFLYYGSPIPGTLEAKRAQAASNVWWLPFHEGLVDWVRANGAPGGYGVLLFPLAAIGGLGAVRFRWLALPVAWAAAHSVAYSILNPAFYVWYAVPAMLGLAILVGLGTEVVAALVRGSFRQLSRQPGTAVIEGLCALGLLLVLAPAFRAQTSYAERNRFRRPSVSASLTAAPDDRLFSQGRESIPLNSWQEIGVRVQLYEAVGKWLRENTPQEASVAYYEVGYMGFYAHRRIVDEMGLIEPEVAAHVRTRDFQWVFRHFSPDYIVLSPYSLCGCVGQLWFGNDYHLVTEVNMRGTYPLRIYERATGSVASGIP